MVASTANTENNANNANNAIVGNKPSPGVLIFIIMIIMLAVFKMGVMGENSSSYFIICAFILILLAFNTFKSAKSAQMFIIILGLIALTVSNKESLSIIENLGILRCEVLLITAIILISMLLINMNNWNMEPSKTEGNVLKEVRIEGLECINADAKQTFCDKYQTEPDELNKQCAKFDKTSCNIPSCCVWLNGKSCVAGDSNGPTFTTDDNMNDIDVDYYNHQGTCYGNCEE